MAPSDAPKPPTCHILDFFYDDEDSSALTALINGVRFHIIVDVKDLRNAGGGSLLNEYLSLLQNAKSAKDDDAPPKEHSEPVPGSDSHDSASENSASSRQSDSTLENVKHDTDSAIDLTADNDNRLRRRKSEPEAATGDSEQKLQNWILSFFTEETKELAPPIDGAKEPSLQDWYSGVTYFFDLDIVRDQLAPRRLEESSELCETINGLVPRMTVPKYIREMDLPWVSAENITVLSELSDPAPVHPGEVRVGDEVRFSKPVDPNQPQVTKREIKILQKLGILGLRDTIRFPQLLGLVTFEKSSIEIIGFLLMRIPAAKPLTTLLTSEVPEWQRLEWADKSKDVVKTLHENGIIWGDAKADNFLIDENDELWIIDFGGSYTEGWVDPEISETKEGDKMGVEKVVEALIDPDENTFDPEDDDEADSDYKPQARKRKRASSTASEQGQKKSRNC